MAVADEVQNVPGRSDRETPPRLKPALLTVHSLSVYRRDLLGCQCTWSFEIMEPISWYIQSEAKSMKSGKGKVYSLHRLMDSNHAPWKVQETL